MNEIMDVATLKILYHRETENLRLLKDEMDKIHRKQELYTNDLTNIITEYNSCKTVLNEIENELSVIVKKYRNLLTVITFSGYAILGFLGIILFLGMLILDITLLIKVTKSITDVNKVLWGTFGLAAGLAGAEVFIGKKITKFLDNKFETFMLKIAGFIIEKGENSKQYKELEYLKNVALEMIEQVKLEKEKIEADKNSLDLEYNNLKNEYGYKKGIVEYLNKQINPTEMTTNLSKTLEK